MSVKARLAAKHFVLQGFHDFNLYFVSGDSDTFIESDFSPASILNIQSDETVNLVMDPDGCRRAYKVMLVGSEAEVADYKRNVDFNAGSNEVVTADVVRQMKAEYSSTVASLTARVEKAEARIKVLEGGKKTKRYKRKTRDNMDDLRVVIKNAKGEYTTLGEHRKNPDALKTHLIKTQPPFFTITSKYQIDIEIQLNYLRNFIEQRLSNPKLCGYAVIIQFLDIDSFCKSFMPVDPNQPNVRTSGLGTKKISLNKSFANLFKDILLWCGARVFIQQDFQAWFQLDLRLVCMKKTIRTTFQLAVDGINERVNNFNSKKQRLKLTPNVPVIWNDMAACDSWHAALQPKSLPSATVAVDDAEKENNAGEDEGYVTVEPDPNQLNSPF